MASIDRIFKHLVDTLQAGFAPLSDIRQNQEIVIAQNKQIIGLLEQLRSTEPVHTAVEDTTTDTAEAAETV